MFWGGRGSRRAGRCSAGASPYLVFRPTLFAWTAYYYALGVLNLASWRSNLFCFSSSKHVLKRAVESQQDDDDDRADDQRLPPLFLAAGFFLSGGDARSFALGSLLAVVFGIMGIRQVNRAEGRLTGKGLAVAGLVLGLLGLAFMVWALIASPDTTDSGPR